MLSRDLNRCPETIIMEDKIHYIMLIKDPYSWYLSICKWNTIDPFPLNKDKLEQLYLWNYMGGKYIDFYFKTHSCIIRYEDLLNNLSRVINSLTDVYGYSCNSGIIDLETNVYDGRDMSNRRKFFAEEEYLHLYSKEDFIAIEDFIDPEVVGSLGYKIH